MARNRRRRPAYLANPGVPTPLLVLLLLVTPAIAQPGHIAHEKRTQLETAIARFMASNSTPGVSVAVVEME